LFSDQLDRRNGGLVSIQVGLVLRFELIYIFAKLLGAWVKPEFSIEKNLMNISVEVVGLANFINVFNFDFLPKYLAIFRGMRDNMIKYECKRFHELHVEELYQILQFRQKVFVVEQNCPYLDCDDKDQESFHLLGKTYTGKLLTYARLLPPDLSYPEDTSIGRVLCDTGIRKTGAGKQLMMEAIAHCKKLFGPLDIRISAQQYLLQFYSDLGFVAEGKVYLEDDIPHIEMVRKF